MTTDRIYLCIFRDERGEKIAENVTARIPKVGEIISLSYLDAQGKFEVLQVNELMSLVEYELVALKVRPVTPHDAQSRKKPSWITKH